MKRTRCLERTIRGRARVAMWCAMAGWLGGLTGCRQEEATEQAPPDRGSVPASVDVPPAADGWVEMQGLEAGSWVAIDGAADVDWDGENDVLGIGIGHDLNGVRWTGELPAAPYELELEARRMSGNDFFCGLTFPVRSETECVTLIVGGWGGELVGISSIDGLDASENSTGSMQPFEDGRWYRIRVRVEQERVLAWIDDREMVDADILERRLSLRAGQIEDCAPLGLATWLTRAELRGMRWRGIRE